MELIPILSTIILVATISTFILAIGAYILYKIREAKGQQVAHAQPKEVEAELITPATAPSVQTKESPSKGRAYEERQPIFVQQKQQTQKPMQPKFTPQPQQYRQPSYVRMRSFEGDNAVPLKEKKSTETRFLKYTSEGYVDAKNDKDSGTLKWR